MSQGNFRPIAPVETHSVRTAAGMRAASVAWICAVALFAVACIGAPAVPVAAGQVMTSPLAAEVAQAPLAGGEPLIQPAETHAAGAGFPGEPLVFTGTAALDSIPVNEGDVSVPQTMATPPDGEKEELTPASAGLANVVATIGSASTTTTVVVPQSVEPEPTVPEPTALDEPQAADPTAEVSVAVPITIALEQPLPGPAAIFIAPSLPAPPSDEPAPLPVPPPADLIPDGVARTLRVPVLMYHYLSVPPANADIYRKDLSVAPELFAAHLDRLRDEGYTTISPSMFIAALQQGAPLPEKPVLITFDDGYRDNFENAIPLLRERNMVATFFIVTDFIDEERPQYLTWEMAREMLAGGMSIESHGRNHATLEGRDNDYLVWQALGSLETIQHELGIRPRFVSYPAGEYDDNTIALFASAGYHAGFTTRQSSTHDSLLPFELGRVRVRGTTSADDLMRLLNVDW